MIKYVFSDQPLTIKAAAKANPQKIGEALAEITAANKGRLQPQQVVDAAKTDRRLKPHFEWDDKVAANALRLAQARDIIRCVNITNENAESGASRAFLSVRDKEGVSYRAIDEILGSSDLQSKVLAAAERDLLAWETRYRALEDLCLLIRQVREQVAERRAKGTRGQALHA